MGSSTHLDIHCALLVLDLCWYPARSPGARGQPRTGCCHLCTYVIGPLVGFGSHDCHMTGHFQACMHASSLVVCFGSILILYLVVTHVVVELAALRVLSFTMAGLRSGRGCTRAWSAARSRTCMCAGFWVAAAGALLLLLLLLPVRVLLRMPCAVLPVQLLHVQPCALTSCSAPSTG